MLALSQPPQRLRRYSLILSLLLLATRAAFGQPPIPDFSLPTTDGSDFSLASIHADLVVVIFLGTECPLVELYAPKLRELSARYGTRAVQFLAIDSNCQDSWTDLKEFREKHQIDFPMLKDAEHTVANHFQATRTPEVFLLDRHHQVRYQGRIDDQYGIGYRRPAPQRRFLAEAIEQLLQGQPIETPFTEAVGCKIGRDRPTDPSGDVTWHEQIAPIFQDHCQQCHRPGQIAPFSLTNYIEARAWGETIEEVVQQERMPPWGANREHGSFANDPSLSAAEKELILQWVRAGCPEGDAARGPAPRHFTEGWQLERPPDLILPMSEKPYNVPAEGVVEYQYFIADPKLTEGRWVVAAECRPGNRRVVHHVSLFLLLPGMQPAAATALGELWSLQKNLLCTYVPGMRPVTFPAGTAYYMPVGTKIVFQVHYTPIGSEEEDCCELGLLFAEASTIERQLTTLPLINSWFEIPPGAPAHIVEAWHTFRGETLIHGFFPHLHLRGRSFRYIAHFPDGNRQILCDVPRYQFDWQTRYLLSEAIAMPAGSKIQCIASYDNSNGNLNNPDPGATVRWGDQSFEEMMIGYLDISTPRKIASDDEPAPSSNHSTPWLTIAVTVAFLSFATTPWIQRSSAGDRHAGE